MKTTAAAGASGCFESGGAGSWRGLSGLGAYFGVDVNLVRLAFGVLTVFYGLGILLYLIAWLILPEEGEDGSIVESFVSKRTSRL